MLAWLAQALLPVVHASVMSGAGGGGQIWCGDPASAQAALALLPADLRAALDGGDKSAADHLMDCDAMCAAGHLLQPQQPGVVTSLRIAGIEAPRPAVPHPATRPQAAPPPAHAPPAHD